MFEIFLRAEKFLHCWHEN